MKRLRVYTLFIVILLVIGGGILLYLHSRNIIPDFVDSIKIYRMDKDKEVLFADDDPRLLFLISQAYNQGTRLDGGKQDPGQEYIVRLDMSYGITRDLTLNIIPGTFEGWVKMNGLLGEIHSISSENIKQILSYGAFFDDYTLGNQPIPQVDVIIGNDKVDSGRKIIRWSYMKPSGEGLKTIENIVRENSSVPEINVRPGTQIAVSYPEGYDPESMELEIVYDSQIYEAYNLLEGPVQIPDLEGTLLCRLRNVWDEKDYPNSFGVTENYFGCKLDIPPQISATKGILRPGDILSVFVKYLNPDQEVKISIPFYPGDIDTVKCNDYIFSIIPIDWWTSPNTYKMKIDILEDQKVVFSNFMDIIISEDNFETTNQQLVVSDDLKEKTSEESSISDAEYVGRAKSNASDVPLWEGLFIKPVDGSIGTTYGRTRYINGADPYRHSGIDISAGYGTPVKAGNSGRVVMAMELIRTGNTIIIDHGMGLYSSYCHLQGMSAGVGEEVEKGDIIGEVGSTGFSTGPHLHWSITLNGKYVSPNFIMENDMSEFQ